MKTHHFLLRTCERCGDEEVAADLHTWDYVYSTPCTYRHMCSVCEKKHPSSWGETGERTEHDWGVPQPGAKKGQNIRTCRKCQETETFDCAHKWLVDGNHFRCSLCDEMRCRHEARDKSGETVCRFCGRKVCPKCQQEYTYLQSEHNDWIGEWGGTCYKCPHCRETIKEDQDGHPLR